MNRFPPISTKVPHFLHGADYNPDQWKNYKGVWDEDIRLMKLAGCNAAAVGIFSWAALEPEEGRFDFEWLDCIMDKLAKNGIYTILATPTGARPAWMSQKYPEVLRVGADRKRNLHGKRHNHCYTSPVYREKARIINTELAGRYKSHEGLILWHVSNEYGGECHCPLCQDAFRDWLKTKYNNDLDKLNHAWWTSFWSHTFSDWSQIESPAPHGEDQVHGLNLDWRRFVTHQTLGFFKYETEPLRKSTPDIPVTTNFMGTYKWLDYWKMADGVDVVSWDNYPQWHGIEPDWKLASRVGFKHDINRSLKNGKPFMLMESTPSTTNWMNVSTLKKPGMHLLSSIQAVAHGSDTVQYFQWRKSRGSCEKFHGAVVDHCGHENTRVFNEVAQLGNILSKLDDIIGTTVKPQAALIYDWENRWAIEDAKGPRNMGMHYEETCCRHYTELWKQGIPVDVLNMDCDFSNYKAVITPMLYMIRPGVAERLESFVKNGGVLIITYWSGIADENDLCFTGGFPGPLKDILGLWSEEIDALHPGQTNKVVPLDKNFLNTKNIYEAVELCDLIHLRGAESLAKYQEDFYKGRPALTVNQYGKGSAYYISFRSKDSFLGDFYKKIVSRSGINRTVETELPEGVTAQMRTDGKNRYVFIMNFNPFKVDVLLDRVYTDMLTGRCINGCECIKGYGFLILKS